MAVQKCFLFFCAGSAKMQMWTRQKAQLELWYVSVIHYNREMLRNDKHIRTGIEKWELRPRGKKPIPCKNTRRALLDQTHGPSHTSSGWCSFIYLLKFSYDPKSCSNKIITRIRNTDILLYKTLLVSFLTKQTLLWLQQSDNGSTWLLLTNAMIWGQWWKSQACQSLFKWT